jgi:hypothetical protein
VPRNGTPQLMRTSGEDARTNLARRTLVKGSTALATVGALTGPSLLEWAKTRAQTAPWQAEKGAQLSLLPRSTPQTECRPISQSPGGYPIFWNRRSGIVHDREGYLEFGT